MMTAKRRVYTAEFKREAVRLVTEPGDGVTEAAGNLGIHVKMLGRWKRQAVQHPKGSIGGNGQMSAEHEKLLRLRNETQRLRLEREILTKATVFFAKESSCHTRSWRTISSRGRSRCGVRCWELGAAGFMMTANDRLNSRRALRRWLCVRVSRRSPQSRSTVTAVGA
jgi:transposase